jgi:hypothetical protein
LWIPLETSTLFDLITRNKVNKVCGGVLRAATEVEDEGNMVFSERTVLPWGYLSVFGIELVILIHLLICGIIHIQPHWDKQVDFEPPDEGITCAATVAVCGCFWR